MVDKGFAAAREAFRPNLDRADQVNRDLILRFTSGRFKSRLGPSDLPDVAGDKLAALAEWETQVAALWKEMSGRPDRFQSLRRAIEDDLTTSFFGLINERRQRALGIDQYVWRSRDDAKVRDLHAAHDDQVFDWDTPPEGGHPGQDINCRCYAEPLVLDEPEYVPDTGPDYVLGRVGAEIDGIEAAAADVVGEIVGALADLPHQAAAAARFAVLLAKEARGTLTPEEAAELRATRERIEARLREVVELLRDGPEIAAAFRDYVMAVESRPALADAAYRQVPRDRSPGAGRVPRPGVS